MSRQPNRTLCTISKLSHFQINGDALELWRFNETANRHEIVKIALDDWEAATICFDLRKMLTKRLARLADLVERAGGEQ